MPESTSPKTGTTPAETPASDAEDAVDRCCEAWDNAYAAEYPKNASEWDAEKVAMCTPSSEDTIRDFIACVTQGILLGVFKEKQATQLLYAAQVASGALTRARKLHSRKALHPRKSAT
jgi:hypothetical protein